MRKGTRATLMSCYVLNNGVCSSLLGTKGICPMSLMLSRELGRLDLEEQWLCSNAQEQHSHPAVC